MSTGTATVDQTGFRVNSASESTPGGQGLPAAPPVLIIENSPQARELYWMSSCFITSSGIVQVGYRVHLTRPTRSS